MSAPVTLTAMIARVRFEADMINSTRVSDAQITTLINTHYAELYDRLVAAGPPDYFMSSSTITTVAGTVQYNLPSDFRSMLGLFINDDSSRRREVRAVQEGQRASYSAPLGVVTLTLEYVAAPTALVSGGDTIDSVSGWDELVVQLCARALLRRERRDVSAQDVAIAEARARIMANAPKRDQSGPRYINDVEAVDDWPLFGYNTSVTAYRLQAGVINLYTISPTWP